MLTSACRLAAVALIATLAQSAARAEREDRFVAQAPGHQEPLAAERADAHPMLAPDCGGYPFGGVHAHCGIATGGPSGGLF